MEYLKDQEIQNLQKLHEELDQPLEKLGEIRSRKRRASVDHESSRILAPIREAFQKLNEFLREHPLSEIEEKLHPLEVPEEEHIQPMHDTTAAKETTCSLPSQHLVRPTPDKDKSRESQVALTYIPDSYAEVDEFLLRPCESQSSVSAAVNVNESLYLYPEDNYIYSNLKSEIEITPNRSEGSVLQQQGALSEGYGSAEATDSIASWGREFLGRGDRMKAALFQLIPQPVAHVILPASDNRPIAPTASRLIAAPGTQRVPGSPLEATWPLEYIGVPLILSEGLSTAGLAQLQACERRGWVERLRSSTNNLDASRIRIMVVDAVARKSGLDLCHRSLTYVNCLTLGYWIVNISWLIASLQSGRLIFPRSTSFTGEDIEPALKPFEIGGTTLDFVMGSPRRSRLSFNDTRSNLLRGFSIILLEPGSEAVAEGSVLTLNTIDVRVLIDRSGGEVAEKTQSASSSAEDNDCTCDDEFSEAGDRLTIAIDLTEPVKLSDVSKPIVCRQSPASARKADYIAVVSVEWLLDAICNQRPSKDFKLFATAAHNFDC